MLKGLIKGFIKVRIARAVFNMFSNRRRR